MIEKWKTEPNEKRFTYKGYDCFISRVKHLGTLCGYVLLPVGHLLHGKDYDDPPLCQLSVHGGITFSGLFFDDDPRWYVGFDCAHSGDFIPDASYQAHAQVMNPLINKLFDGVLPSDILGNGEYRDMEYVEKEIRDLVDQIVEATGESHV